MLPSGWSWMRRQLEKGIILNSHLRGQEQLCQNHNAGRLQISQSAGSSAADPDEQLDCGHMAYTI